MFYLVEYIPKIIIFKILSFIKYKTDYCKLNKVQLIIKKKKKINNEKIKNIFYTSFTVTCIYLKNILITYF